MRDSARIGPLVPMPLQLALRHPPRAALQVRIGPEPLYLLVVWNTHVPADDAATWVTEETVLAISALAVEQLAAGHEESESARLSAVLGALVQAIVVIDDVSTEMTLLARAQEEVSYKERSRRAMTDSAIGMAVIDHEGRFLEANQALCDFLGANIAEVLRNGWRHYVHPEDLADDEANVLRLARGDYEHYRRERRYLRADGQTIYGDVSLIAVRGQAPAENYVIAQVIDITARTLAEQARRASEARYRLLAENASDVVARVDADGAISWVSPSVVHMLGWQPGDVSGRPLSTFLVDETAEPKPLTEGSAERSHVATRIRCADGSHKWVELTVTEVHDRHSGEDSAVIGIRDIEAEMQARQLLERRARHDALTNLINRDEVFRRLDALLSIARPPSPRIALVFADFDKFKHVNDTFGHAAGDELLRITADRLRAAVRPGDLVSRIGGDELLVVLNGVADLAAAVEFTGRLREAAKEPLRITQGMLTPTLSFGVTIAEPGESADDILARADSAMYDAKDSGRDQVVAISRPTRAE